MSLNYKQPAFLFGEDLNASLSTPLAGDAYICRSKKSCLDAIECCFVMLFRIPVIDAFGCSCIFH
jgi:hypothetical protein